MGWNYRKSIKLGGGLRLNLSKSGIGISGGVKGFRISHNSRGSRLYASIPGTGIYYTKNLSSKKKTSGSARSTRSSQPTTVRQYQYSQVVTNEHTGESRELRARTQWELDEMVRVEQQRQYVNETRQKAMELARDMQQRVDVMNEQIKASQRAYSTLLEHTLDVNDRIDWEKEMIKSEYPAFTFNEKAPKLNYNYKLSFWKSLFIKAETFEIPKVDDAQMKAYEQRRNSALNQYLIKKAEFDREKNKRNGETQYLKKRFEDNDKDAIERYVSLVLTKSEYPADFEHDFDIVYKKEGKTLIVNFLFQDIDEFPIVEKYEYNSATREVDEKLMTKDQAISFYTRVLFSTGIRTIHEVLESVYTDAVDVVCFNGYIANDEDNQCAFGMKVPRSIFESIDLKSSNLSEIVSHFETRTIRDFTSDEQVSAYI